MIRDDKRNKTKCVINHKPFSIAPGYTESLRKYANYFNSLTSLWHKTYGGGHLNVFTVNRFSGKTARCCVLSHPRLPPKSLLRLEEVLGKAYQQIHVDFTRSTRFHVGWWTDKGKICQPTRHLNIQFAAIKTRSEHALCGLHSLTPMFIFTGFESVAVLRRTPWLAMLAS